MPPPRAEIGEEYLSQVTHELRGSLNAILGWAEFLRSGPCDDDARVRAAETIIRHARQQSWTVGELVDTWRLASGTLTFSVGSYNIAEMVESALSAVQPLAKAKSVRVELKRERRATARGRGDVKRIAQAMTSLLSNAVHFAPEQTSVTVRVEAADGVHIAIHDAGPSVAQTALPFLFDRNRPLEAVRACPRGNFRLGLGFARDVITRHGGTIQAESGGEGMTFHVVLPVEDGKTESPEDGGGEVVDSPGAHRNPPKVGGVRVLLVDDEPDAREALTGILQHYGAVVRSAGSAADAISALQHEPFDVLLADIGMPGADGYDLIRYVRALESGTTVHVPAVAVTAFASDADRRRALDAGYQVHLSKPVDPAALIATVAALGRPAASVR